MEHAAGSFGGDDPLQPSQKQDLAALFAEARTRADLGVGVIWKPQSGSGVRPSAVYARGVWSLETAAFDIESVSRAQPCTRRPIEHLITSWNAEESKWISDEQAIRIAEQLVDRVGYEGHQAVFAVHRDTDSVHVHTAISTVNAQTLYAADRHNNWIRKDWALRELEIEHRLSHDHGLAVVRDAGLPTQRIEVATFAERRLWAKERGAAKERLEDQARSFVADSDGLEKPEDRRERIVSKIRQVLDRTEERGEKPLRADVFLAAAELAATIEPGAPEGSIRIRLMHRAEKERVQIRTSVDEFGDEHTRYAAWIPSEHVFDVPIAQLAPGPLDAGGYGGTKFEVAQQKKALSRRAWLADLGDVERSEREVEDLLSRDPGRVSRDIIASGDALFTAEDVDRWTCSRLSDSGPEWTDRVLREDSTIVVRSPDTEHALLTTRKQLDLETHVFECAGRMAKDTNPLFDRAKLNQAITDIEAEESEKKGKPFAFTAEQKAALDLLEYRFGTINGVAGAGKSSLMAAVRRYAELTGQPIAGFTTAQVAAERLKEASGIKSVNATRGLALEKARGKELVEANALIIVDEYSMTSLESAKEILDRIEARPRATVLYIGGGAQLGNIQAGDTHRVLAEAAKKHGQHRELTEVFRQSDDVAWMRDVVPKLDKAILEADAEGVRAGFEEFDKRGVIVYHADRKAEVAAKAADIVSAMRRGLRVIAPGCERIEAKYVNRAVRHALGHVGKGILYNLEGRKREFSPGDRIVFNRNQEFKLGVLNGYTGTVKSVALHQIVVELDSGRTLSVDPAKYPHLEWAYAVTTHKTQGLGDPVVVASITRSDDARSAFVALTRCEAELHVHSRLLPFDPARPAEERVRELLVHLSSDTSIRPKDDALLFESTAARFGGPDSQWAVAVRRAMRAESSPLRQAHQAEMQERFAERGVAVAKLLAENRQKIALAMKYPDLAKKEKRLASIAASERSAIEKLDRKFALEPFVTWCARNRKNVEHAAPFLERQAEKEDERLAQRAAREISKAPGMALVEQQRAEAQAIDEQIRQDKIEAANEAQREIHTRNLTIVRAACAPITDTKGDEYLAGRGLSKTGHNITSVRFAKNWPEGVTTNSGRTSPGHGPAVVFQFQNPAGTVVAAQGRYLDPPVFDGKAMKMWSVGAIGEGVFWTPGARESNVVGICEAPIDALSLAACGLPAIAMGGTQNQPPFLAEMLAGRKVVLALDNDAPGIDAAGKLEELLAQSQTTRLVLPPGIKGATVKDVNEALTRVPHALAYAVQAATARVGMKTEIEQTRQKLQHERGISRGGMSR